MSVLRTSTERAIRRRLTGGRWRGHRRPGRLLGLAASGAGPATTVRHRSTARVRPTPPWPSRHGPRGPRSRGPQRQLHVHRLAGRAAPPTRSTRPHSPAPRPSTPSSTRHTAARTHKACPGASRTPRTWPGRSPSCTTWRSIPQARTRSHTSTSRRSPSPASSWATSRHGQARQSARTTRAWSCRTSRSPSTCALASRAPPPSSTTGSSTPIRASTPPGSPPMASRRTCGCGKWTMDRLRAVSVTGAANTTTQAARTNRPQAIASGHRALVDRLRRVRLRLRLPRRRGLGGERLGQLDPALRQEHRRRPEVGGLGADNLPDTGRRLQQPDTDSVSNVGLLLHPLPVRHDAHTADLQGAVLRARVSSTPWSKFMRYIACTGQVKMADNRLLAVAGHLVPVHGQRHRLHDELGRR